MKHYLFFAIILAAYFFGAVGLTNSGDTPQYLLTQSLVDHHSFCLPNDNFEFYPDVAVSENCYLSGRGPGESFMAIPFYLFTKYYRSVLALPYNGFREGIVASSAEESSVVMLNALFGALSVYTVFRLARIMSGHRLAAYVASLMFAFGTLNWKYSTIFYRHTIGVFFMLSAVYFLFRLLYDSFRWSRLLFLAACVGFALFVEPTLVLFGLVVFAVFICKEIFARSSVIKLVKYSFVFGLAVVFINLPIFWYNYRVFGSPFDSGWSRQLVNTWLGDKKVAFSTPLKESVMVNLFSPARPIPASAFSPWFLENEQVRLEQGYDTASNIGYKGIFFQSPFLFLIFLAPFCFRSRRQIFLIFTLAFAAGFFTFKYLVFYSPNSYDTRFFLPLYALFSVLVAPVLSSVLRQKNEARKLLYEFIIFLLFLISFIHGWISEVENYAPHVTGEKRAFAFELLQYGNIPLILRETFPNFYNYKIFLLYLLAFYLAGYFYFLIQHRFPKKSSRSN